MYFLGLIAVTLVAAVASITQDDIDYMAVNIKVTYIVVDNLVDGSASFQGQFKFENTGSRDIQDKDWAIHWNSLRMMEFKNLLQGPNNYPSKDGAPLGDESTNLRVYHENGNLFMIKPTATFGGFRPNSEITVPWISQNWEAVRSDVFPYWFVEGPGLEARTIVNTASETIDYAPPFNTENQWKRHVNDRYNPYTPEIRFEIQDGRAKDTTKPVNNIVPTPLASNLTSDEHVDLGTGDWLVVSLQHLDNEAKYLADQLGTLAVRPEEAPNSKYILLELNDGSVTNQEGYNMMISRNPDKIEIKGGTGGNAGVFYGCQSLLALLHGDGRLVPTGSIQDAPRFGFRGMNIDVGRNFQSKEAILELLDLMGQYKLNKFHFHLTDDEGWRLEIPGLPELTETGARRCFSHVPDLCIMPQFGSGPGVMTAGTGYYTMTEYREILKYANDRHIEVIPEFDMPGHGHAAIKAMEARFNKFKDIDMGKATEFLLRDPNDTSEYVSVQMFKDNAIDPCRQSTYNFVQHLIDEVVLMHRGVQPLKVFHFGGDEVPGTAWTNSTLCQSPPPGRNNFTSVEELKAVWKEYFVSQVASYTHGLGLDLGAWEDGLMTGTHDAFNRSYMPNENVYGMAWDNIWEWGRGSRAYILANAGYQIVLSHATNLYFDHPQEPDPEERGFYWATRFADTFKTFGYIPDKVYNNIDISGLGDQLDKDAVCQQHGCVPLEKPENIVGIQGQLWSESVRLKSHFDDMVYPRFIALAERAWHKASWEDLEDKVERERERNVDWENFANLLGKQELRRFDSRGIAYNIPPPGVSISQNDVATANSAFPGLPIQFSFDNGVTWLDYTSPVQLTEDSDVLFIVKSSDSARSSRAVMVSTKTTL